jgi:hypothetical protein
MIFKDLQGLLIADSALNAVLQGRVYFLSAPAQQAYPDIIQYPAAGFMDTDLEGRSPPWTRRISFECRGTRYGDESLSGTAHWVGDQVIRVLNNYIGNPGTEQIQGCHLVSDMPDVDEQSAIKRRIIDFRVTHSPAD